MSNFMFDSRQGAIIDQVFTQVWSKLRMDYMLVTDYLIGMDSHIEKMKELLQLDYESVKVIGIHGMGGIGKTTIAKAIYNKVRAKFDRCCFVENVRETLSSKSDGIASVQGKIIRSILQSDYKVRDVNEGICMIRNRVCKHKVLIVLDDVDGRFEFDKVLGKLEDFSSGSRFIITTRDRRVVEFFQPNYELFEPEEMSEDDSLQLFSRHAFGVDRPPSEDVPLSMEFVKAASCLPLSIKVIGSLLFRRNESFWRETLKKLEDVLPSEVQERLRISYNTLSYEERQIFLDIACFLVGEDKAKSFHMWNSCGYHPEIAITTLIERSFVKINQKDEKQEFWMHDHMIDLGKRIVREEDIECPWKRSRIWSNTDAMDMLAHEKGTDRVKGVRVEIRNKSFKLTARQFEKLSQLSVTQDWSGWQNIKAAHNLKAICLRGCNSIRCVPDLSEWRNLESIDIRVCDRMRGELHVGNLGYLKFLTISNSPITKLVGDFGKLQNLQEITVRGRHLRSFPDGIARLSSSSLVHLSVETRCMTNKETLTLPASLMRVKLDSISYVGNLAELERLEELEFDGYGGRFPRDDRLSKLKSLMLSNFRCASLCHDDCGLPSSLVSLEIRSSMRLVRLPDLGNLCNLRVMFLWKTSVSEIPGLEKLRMLESLKIVEAPGLRSLDGVEHQTRLASLVVESCDLLEKLPDLSCFVHLQILTILGCKQLARVGGIENLEGLTTLRIDTKFDIPPLRRTVKVVRK
ncbi:Disease resistance protein L6 [Linum grandiflorum]